MKQLLLNDSIIFYLREDNENDDAIVREIFDEDVYQVSGLELNGKTVVDIGANIGAFSVYCWKRGAARVIAYEPEPHNWEILKANAGSEIETRQQAISTSKQIRLSNQGGESHQVKTGGTLCDAVTLDQALFGVDQIDVLKIDIEGGEYDILTAASDETLNRVIVITMEFHATTAKQFGLMIAKLSKHFNTHFFGSYERGGMLYGRHYQ